MSGSVSQGQIGTSYYSEGELYILGHENNDTDEYDGHIVIHEWAHYFEDKLSRSDSIGGSHSGGQRLDMRVAFGEGFGNAFSGIVTDDPFYRDTSGFRQSSGFNFSVDSNFTVNPGWYNESSVESILYDLYDSGDETGLDTVSMGFAPLYEVLVGAQKNTPAFTSIFSFIEALRNENPDEVEAIDVLVSDQQINSSEIDLYGSNETNDGSTSSVLPVYKTVPVDDPIGVNVCTVRNNGTYNKLGATEFLKFTLDRSRRFDFKMERTSSPSATDPDFYVYKNGQQVIRAESFGADIESTSASLSSGDYVMYVTDYEHQNGAQGPSCFDITIID